MTVQNPQDPQSTIAIASGKGGVGKSTVAVNLALALSEKGKSVGLLDADIYGPNIPLMLGLENEIAEVRENRLLPVNKHGVKTMSVGFISPAEKALVWRGPLANKLIEQFLTEVEWGALDILVIDLPPGTGDVPLSIVQKAKLNGGIIVSTPQEASIADVKKMINMYTITNTPILGIIENMKYITCPDSQTNIDLFPNRDPRPISEILGHELLAEFPFVPALGLKDKDGTPYFLKYPEADLVQAYRKLAQLVIEKLGPS